LSTDSYNANQTAAKEKTGVRNIVETGPGKVRRLCSDPAVEEGKERREFSVRVRLIADDRGEKVDQGTTMGAITIMGVGVVGEDSRLKNRSGGFHCYTRKKKKQSAPEAKFRSKLRGEKVRGGTGERRSSGESRRGHKRRGGSGFSRIGGKGNQPKALQAGEKGLVREACVY